MCSARVCERGARSVAACSAAGELCLARREARHTRFVDRCTLASKSRRCLAQPGEGFGGEGRGTEGSGHEERRERQDEKAISVPPREIRGVCDDNWGGGKVVENQACKRETQRVPVFTTSVINFYQMRILALTLHNFSRLLDVLASTTYKRRPRRPPFLRVLSVGTGVTSSMRPILRPERERARRADWPPGPGLFVLLPPVARILM